MEEEGRGQLVQVENELPGQTRPLALEEVAGGTVVGVENIQSSLEVAGCRLEVAGHKEKLWK